MSITFIGCALGAFYIGALIVAAVLSLRIFRQAFKK